MSVKVMSMVWEADLGSSTRKLVALKLADCANDKGESIYPSIATIARDTGLSRHAVTKTMAEFRRDRLLRVTRQGGPKVGPTRYRMDLQLLYVRQTEVVPLGDYRNKTRVVPLGDEGSPPGGHKPSGEPRVLNGRVPRGTSVIKGLTEKLDAYCQDIDDNDPFGGCE